MGLRYCPEPLTIAVTGSSGLIGTAPTVIPAIRTPVSPE